LNYSAEIRVLTTPQELFSAAAEEVVRIADQSVKERGRFTIALSGGSTPKSLYNLLATNARTTLPWDKMFFFWGDERHVPPGDPESN
jgi:6-phosphogluconolactonase